MFEDQKETTRKLRNKLLREEMRTKLRLERVAEEAEEAREAYQEALRSGDEFALDTARLEQTTTRREYAVVRGDLETVASHRLVMTEVLSTMTNAARMDEVSETVRENLGTLAGPEARELRRELVEAVDATREVMRAATFEVPITQEERAANVESLRNAVMPMPIHHIFVRP